MNGNMYFVYNNKGNKKIVLSLESHFPVNSKEDIANANEEENFNYLMHKNEPAQVSKEKEETLSKSQ